MRACLAPHADVADGGGTPPNPAQRSASVIGARITPEFPGPRDEGEEAMAKSTGKPTLVSVSTRGPLPKRQSESAGHRAKRQIADSVSLDAAVVAPPLPEGPYHPQAVAWYDSLSSSGQSRYFEPSDWQWAIILTVMLDDLLTSTRRSTEMFKAIGAEMDKLGNTENARRRMRVEVTRPRDNEPSSVAKTEAARAGIEARIAALEPPAQRPT